MNRKHNPWVAMVALILLAVVLVCACTGCSVEAEAAETETFRADIGRFDVTFAGYGFPVLNGIYIVTDTQTGVQYLLCETATGVGLTKLEVNHAD